MIRFRQLVVDVMQHQELPILQWRTGDNSHFYAVSDRDTKGIVLRVPEFVIQQLEISGQLEWDIDEVYSNGEISPMWRLTK